MTLWCRIITILPILALSGLLSGCDSQTAEPTVSDIDDQLAASPPEPSFENPELPAPSDARYAASHILIAYTGVASAPETIRLDRDKALEKASLMHQELKNGAPFEAYAQNHSDDPSGPRGGRLGVFSTGTMVPLFERAVASVGIGEIAPLIETPFGFHIVRRDPIIEARASHVLVSHSSAPLSVHSRDKAAAKTRIWGRRTTRYKMGNRLKWYPKHLQTTRRLNQMAISGSSVRVKWCQSSTAPSSACLSARCQSRSKRLMDITSFFAESRLVAGENSIHCIAYFCI